MVKSHEQKMREAVNNLKKIYGNLTAKHNTDTTDEPTKSILHNNNTNSC